MSIAPMHKIFASLLLILTLTAEGASVTMCNFGVFQKNVYEFSSRVRQNGGTIDTVDFIWANEFSLACKDDKDVVSVGVDSMLIFLGSNLAAGLTPFSLSSTVMTVTNQGFVDGDYSVNGLQGDGASYLQTGVFIPQSDFTNSSHIAIYFTSVTDENFSDAGTQDGPVLLGSFYLSAWDNDVGPDFDAYDTDTTRLNPGQSAPLGLVLGVREFANSFLYVGNAGGGFVEIATQSSFSSQDPPQLGMYVMAMNNNGTQYQPTNRRISFFSGGIGVTQAAGGGGNATMFYNAVQKLQQRKGRAQ